MNINNKTLKLVYGALFAALTTVATMFIHLPTLKGYVHLGDAFVMLSGIFLGPLYGGLSAGIGSMLSDVLLGYTAFAPITFVAKFLAAFVIGHVFKMINNKNLKPFIKVSLADFLGAVAIVLSYFVFEIFYEGFYAAALEILPNVLQVVSGIIISSALYSLIPVKIQINREVNQN